MTKKANESSANHNGAFETQHEGVRVIETLADLVALGAELAAKIPEDVRKRERAQMVAYLDEVAAREPSRPRDEPKE